MARVAIDAMGGDHAPAAVVQGAVDAHRAEGVRILLVGREPDLVKALADAGASPTDGLEVHHAPDVIPMDHPDPARAVRSGRDSSIVVASGLVKQGSADAVFSAGPTGASLAAAVLTMGRIRGLARPAITLVLPFGDRPVVLVDAGANADVRPEHLVGFALLGSVFAQVRLGVSEPRIGLLSVGTEPGKGSELTKAAYPLIEASGLRFSGNVEGRDLSTGAVDVVVTDGFTGNVVLKTLEGFSSFLMDELLGVFSASDESKAALEVVLPGLLALRTRLSPESAGGAQLLGVRGVCIIGHGSSGAEAVRAGVVVAASTADAGLVDKVAARVGDGGRSDP